MYWKRYSFFEHLFLRRSTRFFLPKKGINFDEELWSLENKFTKGNIRGLTWGKGNFKGKKCGHKVVELCLSYLTPSLNGHSTQTFLPFYQTQSLSHPVMLLTWLMSPWHVKVLELLLNILWRGCLCCWCQNKTEAMLLMLVKNMFLIPEQKNMLLTPEQNKSHVVDARFVAWICWSCNINLSNLLLGFVDIVTWICQSCFMYLSPLAKSHQAEVWPRFQSFWGFCFEL